MPERPNNTLGGNYPIEADVDIEQDVNRPTWQEIVKLADAYKSTRRIRHVVSHDNDLAYLLKGDIFPWDHVSTVIYPKTNMEAIRFEAVVEGLTFITCFRVFDHHPPLVLPKAEVVAFFDELITRYPETKDAVVSTMVWMLSTVREAHLETAEVISKFTTQVEKLT